MYYRIKNELDAQAISHYLQNFSDKSATQKITSRIVTLTDILDNSYGKERTADSYGGYILFFPTKECYTRNISNILIFHKLDPNDKEYSKLIYSNENTDWFETLYLLSSEDALLLIYPQRR